MLEGLTHAATDFIRIHRDYAPPILALVTFGESLAFISLMLPATTIIVSFMIAAAQIPFWES